LISAFLALKALNSAFKNGGARGQSSLKKAFLAGKSGYAVKKANHG
jgi:hypothetical protein